MTPNGGSFPQRKRNRRQSRFPRPRIRRLVLPTSDPNHPLYSSWLPHCRKLPFKTLDPAQATPEQLGNAALLVTHDTYVDPGRALVSDARGGEVDADPCGWDSGISKHVGTSPSRARGDFPAGVGAQDRLPGAFPGTTTGILGQRRQMRSYGQPALRPILRIEATPTALTTEPMPNPPVMTAADAVVQ